MQTRTAPSRATKVGLFGAGLAFLIVAGPLVFFHLVEGSSPARLALPKASGPLQPGPVSGTWTVGQGSRAGYRVQEILFGQSHTAVGRTDRVTGGIVISGATVTAADFSVDLASVKSDQASRDVQFKGYIMKTYQHPDATFRLTRPIDLGTVPASGREIQATAAGDLEMRGVTRQVSFPLTAERVSGGIDVEAEIPVTFSRWGIPNPSFVVAKVGSGGTVEVLLHLVRARS